MTTADSGFEFPVLVGDIGGTNARFYLIPGPSDSVLSFPTVQTAAYGAIGDAIEHVVGQHRPRTMILAVAGPVTDDAIPLTNCPWIVRLST